MFEDGAPGDGGLVGVGRSDEVQAGDGPQCRVVLDRLVGGAVLAEADGVLGPIRTLPSGERRVRRFRLLIGSRSDCYKKLPSHTARQWTEGRLLETTNCLLPCKSKQHRLLAAARNYLPSDGSNERINADRRLVGLGRICGAAHWA